VTSASQRPLRDNTQHSQQTDIHAPGGIRTQNLSRRAAVDLRLRPRGHWDWPKNTLLIIINRVVCHAECLLHVQQKFHSEWVYLNCCLLVVGAYFKSHTLPMPFETISMTLVPPMFIQKLHGLRTFSNQFSGILSNCVLKFLTPIFIKITDLQICF